MKSLKIAVIALFLFIGFIACNSADKPKGKQVMIEGNKAVEAAFFRQNCAICHGVEANGRELDGRVIPSLRNGEVTKKTDEYLFAQIHSGGNGMPAFRYQMTEEQIRQMVRWIRRDVQGLEK